jgi:uncharacterized protein (DUF983 family)
MPFPNELRDPDRRPRTTPAMPQDAERTTESELALPSFGQFLRLVGRALRLRCPNCGIGKVITPYAKVNERCSHCRFHFTRSSDAYFSGAMFANLAVSELLFALVFGGVLLLSWPNVPWDTLTWGMPLGIALAPILLLPFAKVAWLTFDVMFRPIQPDEIDAIT